MDLVQDRFFQVNICHTGQLKQVKRHVGELSAQTLRIFCLSRPLKMLQHLGSFKAKRDRQVAGSLLLGGIGLVPTVVANEIIHFLCEFFEVHNQKIIPGNLDRIANSSWVAVLRSC